MLGKLLAAFILIPLVEFILLVWIADQTSILATIGLVIVTGIIGSLLARAEGTKAWRRFRETSAQGRLPSAEIQDGLLIAFAAALLLTPGLLTDCLGFFLLIPQTRGLVRKHLAKKWANAVQVSFVSQTRHADGSVDATAWTSVGPSGDLGPGDLGSEKGFDRIGVHPGSVRSKPIKTIDATRVRTLES